MKTKILSDPNHPAAGAPNRMRPPAHENKNDQQLLDLNMQLRNLMAHMQTMREKELAIITQDIMEHLLQQLSTLNMDIAWIGIRAAENLAVVNKLQEMRSKVMDSIHAIRKKMMELRPAILDDFGLEAAIEWEVREFEKNSGIQCIFKSKLSGRKLSRETDIAIFRILKEMLENIRRHANATIAEVRLESTKKKLTLRVTDNGVGISDEQKNSTSSLGLLDMKERVARLGGAFTIARLEQGTLVQVNIPL